MLVSGETELCYPYRVDEEFDLLCHNRVGRHSMSGACVTMLCVQIYTCDGCLSFWLLVLLSCVLFIYISRELACSLCIS